MKALIISVLALIMAACGSLPASNFDFCKPGQVSEGNCIDTEEKSSPFGGDVDGDGIGD